MAKMLPDKPREFAPNSREDVMFEALKLLPDEYYVFHSFKIISVKDGELKESETDFVIFNPEKGILCLEAKAGHPYYDGSDWYYGSGVKMGHDGPYRQASLNKWKLISYISDKKMDDIKDCCKFVHGVWFPSISDDDLMQINLPADADKKITLTSSALDNPQPYIDRIFALAVKKDFETDLSGYQVKRIINSILCPTFNLVPSMKNELELKRTVFNRLIREQTRLLDYLEEQPVAVINGVAGSGKTMLAIEKARRCAEKGEAVLFLCYNKLLQESLKERYKYDNVSFYTIDGLACKICSSETPNIGILANKIEEMFYEGSFPYKHVIIDEGQDFGKDNIEESQIIKLLETVVLDESVDGSFYIFYDKFQLVQGNKIPEYIQEADCKLSLYQNCRNTENIAITSMRPFPNGKRPKLREGALKGDSPILHIVDSIELQKGELYLILEQYKSEGIDDIAILTCKTIEHSAFNGLVEDGYLKCGKKKYLFTSCRKFKGLEADVVILVDIDKLVLIDEGINVFYVGASRARFNLEMIARLSDEDCNSVLTSYGKEANKRPQKALASFLNARYKKN